MGNEKYGIWCLGENINPTLYNRFKSAFRGFRFRKPHADFEPTRGTFDNTTWTDDVATVIADGKYVIVQSIPGPDPNTPAWEYGSPDLVPRITTDRGVYPYGQSSAYKARLLNMWTKMKDWIAALDANDEPYVIVFQSAELSTGDPGTTKGTITGVTVNGITQNNPSSYLISDQEWKTVKRTELWPTFYTNVISNLPYCKPAINVGSDGTDFEWAKANMPGAWFKIGYPTHNYNIPGEVWQKAMIDDCLNSADDENRFFAEFEGVTNLAWFQKAPKANLRTIIVSACAHGMDIVNISLSKMNDIFGTDLSLMVWANRFLGYRRAEQTDEGFCVFRQVIDIAADDYPAVPLSTYPLINPASINSYNSQVAKINNNANLSDTEKIYGITKVKIQYVNPARVTALRALYPNASYLPLDQDQDHNSYENDFGMDMIPGSYSKFVSVINQVTTTKPYWRQGPVNDYKSRNGLGFDTANGKNKIYLTTELTATGNYQVSINVIYLNRGTGVFSLRYHNGTVETIAGLVTCTDTGQYVTHVFTIPNFNGAAALANGAKFILQHESGSDTMVFDSVEFKRIASNDIPNTPPTISAGSNSTITQPTSSVALSGSGSDSDGTIVSWLWQKISGPACTITDPTAQSTTATGMTTAGEYVFQLTGTDDDGASGISTVTHTVVEAGSPSLPIADAGPNQTIQLPVNSVTVSLSASSDPGGSIVAWLWVQNEGPNTANIVSPSAETTDITGLIEGTYIFRGRIQDNDGNIKGDSTVITVLAANNPPIVAITTPDTTLSLPDDSLSVQATATDGDGTITDIQWTQISGDAATIETPTAANTVISSLQPGVNVFELAVTDDNGAVTTDTITITVNDPEEISDYLTGLASTDEATYELSDGIVSLDEMPFEVNADLVTEGRANVTITVTYLDEGTETFHINCIRCLNRKRRILSVKKNDTGELITVSVTTGAFKFTGTLENGADMTISGAIGTAYKQISFVNNDIIPDEV